MLIAAMVMTGCGNNSNTQNAKESKTPDKKEVKRMMIIVDPQIDFISGSLAVAGGQEAIENLIKAINDGISDNYDCIAITQDAHPANHCSFFEQGGIFPPHCVNGTEGQIIYPQLKEALGACDNISISGYYKGQDANKEEFSIFQCENGEILKGVIKKGGYLGIDICGIASDYCVYETLKDLLEFYPAEKVRVAMNCVAAVSDNEKLPAFMKEKGVKAINF